MKYFKLNLLSVIILLNAEIITPQSVVNNVISGNVGERFLMNVNCFKLPIDNSGIIADVEVDTFSGGKLNDDPVLFSAGFGITGKLDNSIWASITFASKRISDFLPGTIEDTSSQSKDIYIVRDSDPAFSSSWQDWKTPVRFGALFYDGDSDGKYNPADKNSNGLWDSNEDMPFILGKTIAWCVFNDSRTSLYRGYSSTFPMSIEVQQYVFADDATHLQNTVFIIYSITNKGLITENLDSVYFSLLVDSDIGEYYDDLSGCDTLLNSGFIYNHESDLSLGDDPPALFATLLQGPIVFTGLENDTSHIKFGINYPEIINAHSVNLPMNFFNMYFLDLYPLDDETVWGYYNRIRGLDRFGNPYNPCTFEHGIVNPESICSEVNPYLLFSGDPLTQQGWINTKYKDQMDIMTAGPFDLKKDIPQYIIAAYTAGKGTDHLNSISITRDLVYSTILEYNSNFNNMTFENGEPWFPVTDYFLHQNYPNPFNPGTVIIYQLPVNGKVTLKVYDILGNEVSILVNEEKPSGTYEVEFNGSKYASGVYFYQLSATGGAGSFMETKKMILIK